jgi:hypothetical protein
MTKHRVVILTNDTDPKTGQPYTYSIVTENIRSVLDGATKNGYIQLSLRPDDPFERAYLPWENVRVIMSRPLTKEELDHE